MTIQIQRGKSVLVYKINEYNSRQILVRVNVPHQRWQHHSRYDNATEAVAALLQLEKDVRAGATKDGTQ